MGRVMELPFDTTLRIPFSWIPLFHLHGCTLPWKASGILHGKNILLRLCKPKNDFNLASYLLACAAWTVPGGDMPSGRHQGAVGAVLPLGGGPGSEGLILESGHFPERSQ